MKIGYRTIATRFFALVGFITLCLIATAAGLWFYMTPIGSTAITTPLEKNLTTVRYFKDVNDLPLVKSEMVQVVKVKVLGESPKMAVFEILYDSKESAQMDDVWISASISHDSGWPLMHYYIPAKASAGRGEVAIVELGVSDEAKTALLASNAITISFYSGGHSPFHEVKYEYQRIWCRNTMRISDLWKQPYPAEKGSKYSINGTRTVSRLCLAENTSSD